MKKNSLQMIVFLSVVTICMFFVLYYFIYSSIFVFGQSVFDFSYKVKQELKQDSDNKNLITVFNSIESDIARIDSYLIPADGEVAFIEEIEQRARNLNLTMEVESVQIERDKNLSSKELEYLSLNILIKGGWSGIYDFISVLSNLPYKILIEGVDLSNVSDDRATSLWQSSIAIKVVKKMK